MFLTKAACRKRSATLVEITNGNENMFLEEFAINCKCFLLQKKKCLLTVRIKVIKGILFRFETLCNGNNYMLKTTLYDYLSRFVVLNLD